MHKSMRLQKMFYGPFPCYSTPQKPPASSETDVPLSTGSPPRSVRPTHLFSTVINPPVPAGPEPLGHTWCGWQNTSTTCPLTLLADQLGRFFSQWIWPQILLVTNWPMRWSLFICLVHGLSDFFISHITLASRKTPIRDTIQQNYQNQGRRARMSLQKAQTEGTHCQRREILTLTFLTDNVNSKSRLWV